MAESKPEHIPAYEFGVLAIELVVLAAAFVSADNGHGAWLAVLAATGCFLVAAALYLWREWRPDKDWDQLLMATLFPGSYVLTAGLLAPGYVFGTETLGLSWPWSGFLAVLPLALLATWIVTVCVHDLRHPRPSRTAHA
jgi:hypothetical protein